MDLSSYAGVLDYLYQQLPMFSKQGSSAIKKDLTNTLKLCAALGNPHHHFKSVHVAGTNGKGSSSHMLAAILQTAGYKTGLYTSPHLLDFRERIRVNGEMIDKKQVIEFVQQNQRLIAEIQPSFFEVTVAMAFDYFAKKDVDIAIIETGLGGRLDSTNIISPEVSLITNIGLDHMAILGDTFEAIAGEKAGIIKPGVPVVISEKDERTAPVFTQAAARNHSAIIFASDDLQATIQAKSQDILAVSVLQQSTNHTELYHIDLTGAYQAKNIIGVLSVIDVLRKQGYPISSQQVHKGLSAVQPLTHLSGRWQTLQKYPTIVCDTGHNEEGWREVMINLNSLKYKRLHVVIGVMRDKDVRSLLTLLPNQASYYFCRTEFERALPEHDLLNLGLDAGLKGGAYTSVKHALTAARNAADMQDAIFIGGSTFVVAEALETLLA